MFVKVVLPMAINLETPLGLEDLLELKAGYEASLNGTIFTARDAAHARLMKLIKEGKNLPFDIEGQIIYYVGPTPAQPGKVIGSAGPTTSYRMDRYTPQLLKRGLRGVIGKGKRSDDVRQAFSTFQAIYFIAVGGAGALLSSHITAAEVVAYPELGPEAIYKLVVKDFPVLVGYDCWGGDIYEQGKNAYRRDERT